MVGILIVTHGKFGEEIIKSTEIIIGKQENTQSIGLFPGDSIDDFKNRITAAIHELDEGEGVLVLVDLFGGSPFNATALNIDMENKETRFQCVTGVNFPMLLYAYSMRSSLTLNELKDNCIENGMQGIKDMLSIIKNDI